MSDRYTLHCGDCLAVLRTLPGASIDAVVTDPPYELGFMGKAWDKSGIANSVELWREVLRVAKPGAHLLAFGGTRTCHRMVCAIEDAGWEIRDSLQWIYATGFPKSLDVSKAIDAAVGATREVVGTREYADGTKGHWGPSAVYAQDTWSQSRNGATLNTAPATDAAKQWEGWGTALKPASEPICLARKPLTGTVAANVLQHGTGALNIDASRVGAESTKRVSNAGTNGVGWGMGSASHVNGSDTGRWPANVVFSHSALCTPRGMARVRGSNTGNRVDRHTTTSEDYYKQGGGGFSTRGRSTATHTDVDGMETVEVWDCAEGCPVGELDRQSGVCKSGYMAAGTPRASIMGFNGAMPDHTLQATYGDTGSASRFFYVAKPSRTERDSGLSGDMHTGGELTGRHEGSAGLQSPRAGAGRTSGGRNTHPTVKPVELMRYLVRLITPPDGVVLDMFLGSGTTGAAALAEGFRFVGIDREPSYVAISEARLGVLGIRQHVLFEEVS